MSTSGGRGGGGSSFPDFTGAGSPEGVQIANPAQWYRDATNGALYCKLTGTATNTGWAAGVGHGVDDDAGQIQGIEFETTGGLVIAGTAATQVVITDVAAIEGTGNGIIWTTGHPDGNQIAQIVTGPSGEFSRTFAADGSTSFPGPINIAPATFPTADPHVAGALYMTGYVAGVTPGTLMVSAG